MLTINGSSFAIGATVHFGTAAASNIVVLNASKITASAPAGALGTVDVTVTTGGGTSAAVAADRFTYF